MNIKFGIKALQNTKYPSKEEQKAAIPTIREYFSSPQNIDFNVSAYSAAKKIGVTATSELYEWATKKGSAALRYLIVFNSPFTGVFVDFKFLEPFNFEFKHSMRMWDKKEMLGNYR